MRIARSSLGKMMAVVGLVALNLAAARGLAASEEEILIVAIMPIAIVLQMALFRLIRTKGKRRAFWAGFLTFGLMAMFSFVWANEFSSSIGIASDSITGKTRLVAVPGYFGGDQMHDIWLGYVKRVGRYIPTVPRSQVVGAAILFIPQMLTGLAGGLLAWLVKRGSESRGSDAIDKNSPEFE